ncbi:MAG: thioredoxin family protein [Chitinophagaceae bacterium]|nr:thioredoxin family protein [Chitinophagaceae bacterium]
MAKKIGMFATYMFVVAVVSAQGIDWEDSLSLEQIKEKAKKENKYIFIDAYATWCGPCKAMDKEVYPNDMVGDYMNLKFISVKVQMDKTTRDNEKVKSWYNAAIALQKKYRINSFPSYVFLNPNGEIVHLATGYQPIKLFLQTVKEAVKPGKIYDNPFALYEQLVEDYQQGEKNYSQMPYIVKMAREAGDDTFAQHIAKEYAAYLLDEGSHELYKKESIEFFVNSFRIISSNTRLFKVFYEHGDKVDRVVGKKGYSGEVIDATIRYEIVDPYLGEYSTNMMSLKVPDSLQSPDWKKMYGEIKHKYSASIARKNVLAAKVKFFYKTAQYEQWVPLFFNQLEKYGIDTVSSSYGELNLAAWTIFQKLDNKEYLEKACNLMQIVVNRYPRNSSYADTYANLLYKSGRKQDAIEWENKAVSLVRERSPSIAKAFLSVIEKMKRGEPTWTGKIF